MLRKLTFTDSAAASCSSTAWAQESVAIVEGVFHGSYHTLNEPTKKAVSK